MVELYNDLFLFYSVSDEPTTFAQLWPVVVNGVGCFVHVSTAASIYYNFNYKKEQAVFEAVLILDTFQERIGYLNVCDILRTGKRLLFYAEL